MNVRYRLLEMLPSNGEWAVLKRNGEINERFIPLVGFGKFELSYQITSDTDEERETETRVFPPVNRYSEMVVPWSTSGFDVFRERAEYRFKYAYAVLHWTQCLEANVKENPEQYNLWLRKFTANR